MLLSVVAALAGCSAMGPAPMPTASPGQGGMGLPVQLPGESYPGERDRLATRLVVGQEGCAYVTVDGQRLLAIWPAGSQWSGPVRLPDGTELVDGDELIGTATVVEVDVLPGGPDGWWAHVTGFCTGDAPRAVVFDDVSEAR